MPALTLAAGVLTLVPSSAVAKTVPCGVNLYTVSYYNNTSLAGGPALQACVDEPGGSFGGAPAKGVRSDNFSVDARGSFSLSKATYTLSVTPQNAGVRVWLDNKLVVNRWVAGSWGATLLNFPLAAGRHSLRASYFGTTGQTGLGLSLSRAALGPAATKGNYFSPTSFWNRTLSSSAVDPRSSGWIAKLQAAVSGVSLNDDQWTVPIYTAGKTTPARSILVSNSGKHISIPYLSTYRPSPDGDAHLAVISGSCLYEFQSFNPRNLSAIAEATYRVDRGSGAHVDGPGHAGGELSYLGGLITPQDVKAGIIDHALRYALPAQLNAPTAVYPGTRSDGQNLAGVPEGTKLQLDPKLNLAPFHLTPFQHSVAVALQRYGGYDADGGGSFALYARSTSDGTRYSQAMSGLPKALIGHMRFLSSSTPSSSLQMDDPKNIGCAQQR